MNKTATIIQITDETIPPHNLRLVTYYLDNGRFQYYDYDQQIDGLKVGDQVMIRIEKIE